MKRIEGRKGEAQEFVEFETRDGLRIFTQRAGANYPVFLNAKGALTVLPGPVSTTLAEGERVAREHAERLEAHR